MQISALKLNSVFFGVTISGDGFTGSVTLTDGFQTLIAAGSGTLALATAHTLTLAGSGVSVTLTGTTALPTLTLTAATPTVTSVDTTNGLYVAAGVLKLSATSSEAFGAIVVAGSGSFAGTFSVVGGGTLTTAGALTIAGGITATTANFSGAGTVTGNWLTGTASTITSTGIIFLQKQMAIGTTTFDTVDGTAGNPGGDGLGIHATDSMFEIKSVGNNGILLRRNDGLTGLDMWQSTSNGSVYFDNRFAGSFVFRNSTSGTPVVRLRIGSAGQIFQTATNLVLGLQGDISTLGTSGSTNNAIFSFQNGSNFTTIFMGVNSSQEAWIQCARRDDLSLNRILRINPNGGTLAIGGLFTASGTLQHQIGNVLVDSKTLSLSGADNLTLNSGGTVTMGTVVLSGPLTANGTQNQLESFGLKSGANKSCGTVTLVAGTMTVANTRVTASTIIQLTPQIAGGTQGIISKGTVVAGTSFDIVSSSLLDTSTIGWQLTEPY